jgi:hypothetical protein
MVAVVGDVVMAGAEKSGSVRVRPHVARAVGRARCVLLDFDGVMFDVRGALGPEARERAIAAFLDSRPHRPRSLFVTFAWVGVHQVLASTRSRPAPTGG